MFMKNNIFEFKIREANIEDANVLAAAEREIAKIPGRLASRPHEMKDSDLQKFYRLTRFNLKALKTTDTELRLIAAAAIIGLKRIPKKGYRTPAAIGTPRAL